MQNWTKEWKLKRKMWRMVSVDNCASTGPLGVKPPRSPPPLHTNRLILSVFIAETESDSRHQLWHQNSTFNSKMTTTRLYLLGHNKRFLPRCIKQQDKIFLILGWYESFSTSIILNELYLVLFRIWNLDTFSNASFISRRQEGIFCFNEGNDNG